MAQLTSDPASVAATPRSNESRDRTARAWKAAGSNRNFQLVEPPQSAASTARVRPHEDGALPACNSTPRVSTACTATEASNFLPAAFPRAESHFGNGSTAAQTRASTAAVSAGGGALRQPGCDLNRTALNAAALQTVHRHGNAGRYDSNDLLSPRVYNGQILWQRKPQSLDGVPSTDVSYSQDRLGHGKNPSSLELRAAQQHLRSSFLRRPPGTAGST